MGKKQRDEKNLQAAIEGAVLIKNEGHMLPIKEDETVAVFGRHQFEYYRSGTGSGGGVRVAYTTNIIEELIENGVSVNMELVELYRKWLQKNPPDDGGGGWAAEPWFQKEMAFSHELAAQIHQTSRKAIYVIGRTAGEDKDNLYCEGSYLLTEQERENLRVLTECFEEVALILNVSNLIDLSWLEKKELSSCIKAVLFVWQGGMEGGKAAADLICGRETPSGKLPDTIARHIEDYPSHQNFGNRVRNRYQEDIYVGYRYFETFCPEKVQYCFGYGLSYTDFSISVLEAEQQADMIRLCVGVKNTGEIYSGKEVVQVYFEAPQGALGKPRLQLIAFEKTECLSPNETATLEFVIDCKNMVSYDDRGETGYKNSYVMEKGSYYFYVGNSIRNLQKLEVCYHLEETVQIKQLSQAMAPKEDFMVLTTGKKDVSGIYQEEMIPVITADGSLEQRIQENLPKELPITGNLGILLQDVRENRRTMDEFIAQLTKEQLATIVRGEGMSHPKVTRGTASAFGGVGDDLLDYGIPLACCADGPSGLRMDGETTQVPVGTALAASWNTELIKQLYRKVGAEMADNQVDLLLGPGANIHRHPMNGRNFEYYSEDPYLTGKMAIAVTSGLRQAGVSGTIKHFICNEQETNRFAVESVCSERALREIYLKPFQMVVEEGTVQAVMTSYNPVNGFWTASNYDLNTTILRGEWGFDGIVMTDWWARMNDVVYGGKESDKDTRDMVRSQNDVYMVVNNNGAEINSNEDNTLEALKEGTLTVGELQRSAKNICNYLIHSRAIDREQKRDDILAAIPSVKEAPKAEIFTTKEEITMTSGEGYVEVKEAGAYQLIVSISSGLTNLSQSTSRLLMNGQIVTVVQLNGTDGKWITQKLGTVELQKGYYRISVEAVMKGIDFHYALLNGR